MNFNEEIVHQEKNFRNNLDNKEKILIIKILFFRSISLLTNPLRFFKTILMLVYAIIPNRFFLKHKLMNGDDMIKELLSTNKSLIRWGDGETLLAYGQDIAFQKLDQSLVNHLHQILDEYDNNSNYFLAVPLTPILMSPFKLIMSGYYVFWHKTRVLFKKKMFPVGTTFMDAFLMRPVSSISSKSIETLWINKKIILVTSSQESVDFLKDKNGKSLLGYVLLPSENAFSELVSIKRSIIRYCLGEDKSQIRILISAGPTAKVLVYQLSSEGYICYDVGHYLKWKMNEIVPKGVL